MPSQWLSQSMVHCALACVCGQATCCTRTHTHGQVEGPQKPSSQHSSHHQQPPHQHPSNKPHGGHSHTGWSLTHTHTRGKQDKGHSKTKAVVAMACTVTMPWHKRATPVVMPPWLVHQVHAPPMQVATSTHTHSATHTHKRERKEELGEGPQGVERHSGVSETVPLCHPPCPQVSTPPTVRPASPPPGPPSTTHPPPVSEWRHRRVRVWRHTRHTVWCSQHSQPPLSHSHKCPHQHTPTTNPPRTHTHTVDGKGVDGTHWRRKREDQGMGLCGVVDQAHMARDCKDTHDGVVVWRWAKPQCVCLCV